MPSTIPRGIQILNAAIQRLFELLVALLFLAPPSYFERGVFSWFPLYTIRMDDRHFSIGLLALLDPVIAFGWLAVRLATRSAKPWNWGRTGITLPLLGLSLLLLSRLNPHTPLFSAQSVANLTIMWFVYFFILNERPRLWLPLAVVAILLGVIALGQFMTQGDLGLTWLGELPLDPSTRGIVVLQVDGQRLLRAYGLNAPNATAAILVTCVLLLLQHLLVLKGGARWLVVLSCAIGLLGALTTFSRAAWLAFLLALLIWLVWLISASTPGTATQFSRRAAMFKPIVLTLAGLLLIVVSFLALNQPLVASRFFSLNTNPLEMASLEERARAAWVALHLIGQHPWWGVGTGQFRAAGDAISPLVRVAHVAPLRAAAELGLLGGLFWLWLAAAPFLSTSLTAPAPLDGLPSTVELPLRLSPWIVLLVLSMFHLHLWLIGALHAPLLYGLLAANASCPILLLHLPASLETSPAP